MKPGLVPGARTGLIVKVTRDMAAGFAGEMIHPVLSTVALVYHMEWVGRQLILPYLEEGEEGIGAAIHVRHRAPAPIGKEVAFTAVCTEVKRNKVVCRVLAEHDRALVGESEFVQMILPKKKINEQIERMK